MGERWKAVVGRGADALFVGRDAENAAFTAFLAETGPRLLHLHGPPGVGKSTLLTRWVRLAEQHGRRVAHLDGRWVQAAPEEVRRAIDERGGAGDIELLFLDTLERLASLDTWLRDVLLPSLPARVGVVTASRLPLSAAWHTAPGLRSLLRPLALRNLSLKESLAYLEAAGVPRANRRAIAEGSHGYPLALAIAAERGRDDSSAATRASARGPLRQLLLEGTSAPQREALLAAAICREVTEPLLAAMLSELSPVEVADLFEWLRHRPFVQLAERGLLLHELAREVLLPEMQARTPERYDLLLDRACDYFLGQLARSPSREETVRALLFAIRSEPAARQMRLGEVEDHYVDQLSSEEHPAVLETIAHHEGASSARIAARWLARQPDAWLALRGADRKLAGFTFFIDVRTTDPSDVAADPLLGAFERALEEGSPLREGEGALLCRFWMSIVDHQRPSSLHAALFGQLTLRLAFTRGVAVGASVHARPREWQAREDATHRLLAVTELDGVEFGIIGHDWRVESPEQWLRRIIALLRNRSPSLPSPAGPPSAELVLLERGAFERAARRAFRELRMGKALAANPLCASSLVVRHGVTPASEEAAALLRRLLEEIFRAVDDRQLSAILETEFLQPRQKQLASAAALGLGYSTYRRDLAIATRQIVDRLWAEELLATGPSR